MNDNTEALRITIKDLTHAAVELRRLHDENEHNYAMSVKWAKEAGKRQDQINELVEALRRCRDMVGHPDNVAFIDAALAKVEASNG